MFLTILSGETVYANNELDAIQYTCVDINILLMEVCFHCNQQYLYLTVICSDVDSASTLVFLTDISYLY